MSFYVITGKSNCPNCAHAIHVAEYLKDHLPNFKYRSILKDDGDWQIWLDKLNYENNWHQTKSPVVWKEIHMRGSKPHLIGGLGEFWEYCYDYYGFQSKLSKTDLVKIMADNDYLSSRHKLQNTRTITIIGALNPMLEFLVMELQNCFDDKPNEAVFLHLYDKQFDNEEYEEQLLQSIEALTPSFRWSYGSVSIVTTLPQALQKCDLLLVIEDHSRAATESVAEWLNRCSSAMLLLAAEINTYAPRNMRVVLSQTGPVCFNASVLAENCTKIRLANIVAVTADEGISYLGTAADHVGEAVGAFGCPPVWGFSGILGFVDVANAVVKGEVRRPFRRAALDRKESTTLARGLICTELRLFGQLTKKEAQLEEAVHERQRKEMRLLHRRPLLAKIRATVSLIRLWYADKESDDIISLGVCSDGSFGFPQGTVFSQPVIQNEKRMWEPLATFPLTFNTKKKIREIIAEVEDLLHQYGLGERMNN